jgi:pimeloyl-ACP methyl ester carboxylesterase
MFSFMRRSASWGALVLAVVGCGQSSSESADASAIDVGVDVDFGSPAPYDHDGPVQYTVESMQLNGSFNVTVYMPTTAGPHPVVSLSCGTSQTAAGYAPHAKRLASYGIATIVADDPGVLTNTGDVLPNALYIIDTWIPSIASIDASKVGLAGHSRGGAVSLLAAEQRKDKVVAWFGLDPVDNEFGQTPQQFARGPLPMIGMPTGFLGAGVTSNCAPAADSYPLLYPRAPSPSVLVVGVGAGHTQLESADACVACSVCSPSGTADSNVVLAYTVRYMTAFFARELLGDSSVGPAFEGAGAPADLAAMRVTVMSK